MLCIPTAVVPGVLADKLAQIAVAGFHSIELSISDVVGFDGSPVQVRSLVASHGLSVQVLGTVPTPLSKEALVAKVEMAHALGAEILMLDVATIPIALPDATSGDPRVALRPDRTSVADVLAFVVQLNRPDIGLALNSGEALGDGSRPARLRDVPGDKVFHVQPTDGPGVPLLPRQGTLNLQGFFATDGARRIQRRVEHCGTVADA
jgi:4-hydroxyphenylpyruvate dioxygenase